MVNTVKYMPKGIPVHTQLTNGVYELGFLDQDLVTKTKEAILKDLLLCKGKVITPKTGFNSFSQKEGETASWFKQGNAYNMKMGTHRRSNPP